MPKLTLLLANLTGRDLAIRLQDDRTSSTFQIPPHGYEELTLHERTEATLAYHDGTPPSEEEPLDVLLLSTCAQDMTVAARHAAGGVSAWRLKARHTLRVSRPGLYRLDIQPTSKRIDFQPLRAAL